jgi:hypothetical protein
MCLESAQLLRLQCGASGSVNSGLYLTCATVSATGRLAVLLQPLFTSLGDIQLKVLLATLVHV